MKNKIGWCNLTFNPVWGCPNHCEYCYAKRIAKRFWKQIYTKEFHYYCDLHPDWAWTGDHLSGLKDFKPTFLESQYVKKFPQKPQRIFVGSMSEIYYWDKEWIEMAIEKVKQYPQHIFQFLTRYPEVYDNYIWPKNCWLGVTITREEDKKRGIPYLFITSCNITFVSVEPLFGPVDPVAFSNANIDWVILGVETGNRKGKIIPKKDWVENMVNYCKWNNIPVYLKDSLKEIYPEKIKMFPENKTINKL